MEQATTTTVQVDGGTLFVRDIGNGQPIIVLHGGPDFDHAYLLQTEMVCSAIAEFLAAS